MSDLVNLMSRIVGQFMQRWSRDKHLIVTNYNPATHSVMGTLMPEGVMSGWIPIRVAGASSQGISVVVGPSIGDQANIAYAEGDPEAAHVTGFSHNDIDQPPMAASGQMIIKHNPSGSMYAVDGSGHVFAAPGQSFTVSAQTIAHTASGSINHTAPTIGINGELNVTGVSNFTGGGNLG